MEIISFIWRIKADALIKEKIESALSAYYSNDVKDDAQEKQQTYKINIIKWVQSPSNKNQHIIEFDEDIHDQRHQCKIVLEHQTKFSDIITIKKT